MVDTSNIAIGLSLSRCISEIASGKVDLQHVRLIATRTDSEARIVPIGDAPPLEGREAFAALIYGIKDDPDYADREGYIDLMWSGNADRAALAMTLFDMGRIVEPLDDHDASGGQIWRVSDENLTTKQLHTKIAALQALHDNEMGIPAIVQMVDKLTKVTIDRAPVLTLDGFLEMLASLRANGYDASQVDGADQILIDTDSHMTLEQWAER